MIGSFGVKLEASELLLYLTGLRFTRKLRHLHVQLAYRALRLKSLTGRHAELGINSLPERVVVKTGKGTPLKFLF